MAFRTSAAATDHYYVATDKLGSVHQIIKRTAPGQDLWLHALRERRCHRGVGVTLRYRWTGREWDAETGWYFHRARYYDPASRRFGRRTRPGWRGVRTSYAYVGVAAGGRGPAGAWAGPEVHAVAQRLLRGESAGWDGWFRDKRYPCLKRYRSSLPQQGSISGAGTCPSGPYNDGMEAWSGGRVARAVVWPHRR
ncbi:MAG: hypothetical protein IPF77_16440 [Gemmatimonadetes bacterium]|nr:hypothetical protein [Gemmatimonadota bacterium]